MKKLIDMIDMVKQISNTILVYKQIEKGNHSSYIHKCISVLYVC